MTKTIKISVVLPILQPPSNVLWHGPYEIVISRKPLFSPSFMKRFLPKTVKVPIRICPGIRKDMCQSKAKLPGNRHRLRCFKAGCFTVFMSDT